MEKEFVPYELAVKLKELGFDEPCIAGYSNSTEKLEFYSRPLVTKDSFTVDAPIYSQAFRWFREKHNAVAAIEPYAKIIINGKNVFSTIQTYEEAELACLKKLIEIIS